jgi:transposase
MPTKSSTSKQKKVALLAEGDGARKQGNVCGIDVHKDMAECCIIDDVSILHLQEYPNTKAGIAKLITTLKKHKISSVAMESTSEYHVKLLFTLLDNNIPALLANPQQTKDTQGKKTDKLDAKRIAIAHRDGRLRPSVIAPREIATLRKATRSLVRIKQLAVQCKQRLNQLFHRKDVNLKDLLKSEWGKQVLLRVYTDEVGSLLDARAPSTKATQKRLGTIASALTTLKKSMDEDERVLFETDIESLIMFDAQVKRLQVTCQGIVEKNEHVKQEFITLLGVPNVGVDTALVGVAEIVDVEHFKKPESLVKWTGLAPRVKQSGHKVHVTGKLHKGGNKYLRRALVLDCAHIYAKAPADHPIAAFMRQKMQETGKYKLALCAGARKLLRAMWYMLSRGTTWSPAVFDDAMEATVKAMLDRKIKAHEAAIKRLESVKEQVSARAREVIDATVARANSRRMVVRALLRAA